MDHKDQVHREDKQKHTNSSSSSSSLSCYSDDHITFENPFRNKFSDSLPPKDPQSFSFVSDSSASQSPAPAGYDLDRIPSSIFSSKPANVAEWSAASTESLFSIQIGNNSFARDHAFMIFKSGELTFAKIEEPPPALPPVEETDNVSAVSNEVEEESTGVNESSPINWEAAELKNVAAPVKTSNSSTSICVSPHSDDGTGSNHSTLSFAFQVLGPADERINNAAKDVSEKRNVQRKIEEQKLMESPVQVMKVEVQPKVSAGRRWFCCLCRRRLSRPSCCSLL